jgi:arylsulfatase
LTAEQQEFQATKMAIHAAMIHRMDIEIGRMVEALKANGQLENTLIMFLSDNGTDCSLLVRSNRPCGCGPFTKPCPHSQDAPLGSANSYLSLGPGWSSAGNTPFRMHKIWTHEGGIATPLIVHWPAGLEAQGAWRHDLGHVVDIVPTVLDLAGAKMEPEPGEPNFAGESLVPAFHEDGAVTRDWLYFNHSGNRALRGPRYKIVSAGEHGGKTWQLYDLSVDRCEMQDLSQREPDIVKEMARKWEALTAQFAKDAGR